MTNFLLLTEKEWHDSLFRNLKNREGENWSRIKKKEKLSFTFLNKFKPDKIFIPHWSYIIPENLIQIYS